MPPKGSKRAVKERVVVAVREEDADANAIAQPKKRAGRTAKPTSNANEEEVLQLVPEPTKKRAARPPKSATAKDAAPVVEETAQLLIAEPKKKRGGRPVKPAAAQDESPVEDDAAQILIAEPKKRGTGRSAKPTAAQDADVIESAAEVTSATPAMPEKPAGRSTVSKKKTVDVAENTPTNGVAVEIKEKPIAKKGRTPNKKQEPVPAMIAQEDNVNDEPTAVAETTPTNGVTVEVTKKSRAPTKKKAPVPVQAPPEDASTADDENDEPTAVAAPPPTKGRKKAATSAGEPTAVPAKRSRTNKKRSDDTEEDQPEVTAARPSKSRSNKMAGETIEEKPVEAAAAVVAVVKPARGSKKPAAATAEAVDEPAVVESVKKTGPAAKKSKAAAAPKPKAAAKTASKRTAKAANGNDNKDDDADVSSSAKRRAATSDQDDNSDAEADDADGEVASTHASPAKRSAKAATKKPAAAKANSTETDYSTHCFDLPADKPYTLKISSWNVAGLRGLCRKDGLRFLDHQQPDIFCMQEIKCLSDEVPDEAKVKGYHYYWNSMPGGHAGVALYSRAMPYNVHYGFDYDATKGRVVPDGRLITAEYMKYFVVCVYVPNSGRKLVTLPERLVWNERFQAHLAALNERKPVIVCGDLNVSHRAMDLANPKSNTRSAGFTEEERSGMDDLLGAGFVDTFRRLYPERAGAYTYWTYMSNARKRNVGWRLDYFLTSERFADKVVDNVICANVLGSDHCPITLFLNL